MFKLIEAVSDAMYDLLRWKRNVKVVMTGVVVTLIWALLGWLLWPFLYGLSTSMMDLLPFAILRSDGAFIFIALIWAVGTMVTFALTMMFFGEIFARKISGERYTRFLPMLIMGISLFWAFVIYLSFEKLYAIFIRILTSLPFEFTEESVAGLIALYLLYNGVVVSLVAIVSLRSKLILEPIREEKYPSEDLIGGMVGTIGATLKDIALFVVILLIVFPLLFIPVANIVLQLALYIWLYKDIFRRDVCELYCTESEKTERKKEHVWAPWVIATVASLMSFIPFVNFFAPVFGEVAAFHYVMKVKESRNDAS
jgi:hypothetical protein